MRVATPIKLEVQRAVKKYTVALEGGQASCSDEQAVSAQLAQHELDGGHLFQTYGEAAHRMAP
jgi:hypothetical protein